MPAENYYCPDNFFKKMTDLDSPKKNNDCYFYYYSTCAKGDNCTFRHEPSALGCETMCSFWKEGKCLNVHCNFRHMELRKNRKAIPCYWESQPVGCLKAHCPFLHQNPRPSDDSSLDRSNISSVSDRSVTDNMLNDELNQQSERKVTAVDSLVVNFEEESDNESGPTYSPKKSGNRIVTVKTLEEIRLEKIQAESAAYYSYFDQDERPFEDPSDAEELRQRILDRMMVNKAVPERIVTLPQAVRPNFPLITTSSRSTKRLSDDQLATILGDESLRKKQKVVYENEAGNLEVKVNKKPESRVLYSVVRDPNSRVVRRRIPTEKPHKNVSEIKIKTLAEIRAEKRNRSMNDISVEENEVTSTSTDETLSENCKEIPAEDSKTVSPKRKIKLRREVPDFDVCGKREAVCSSDVSKMDHTDFSPEQCDVESLSSRTLDEGLLLDSDEDCDDVTLKAEEDLLKDIDSYFND